MKAKETHRPPPQTKTSNYLGAMKRRADHCPPFSRFRSRLSRFQFRISNFASRVPTFTFQLLHASAAPPAATLYNSSSLLRRFTRHMDTPVILSAVRTPIGKFQGGLAGFSAVELGGKIVAEAIRRAAIDPNEVD